MMKHLGMLAMLIVILIAMIDQSESCMSASVKHTSSSGSHTEVGLSTSAGILGRLDGRSRAWIKDENAEIISDLETLAFHKCESDGNYGLTWNEVKICEGKYGALINVKLPTEKDFNHFDTNQDGILLLDEWEKQILIDIENATKAKKD